MNHIKDIGRLCQRLLVYNATNVSTNQATYAQIVTVAI